MAKSIFALFIILMSSLSIKAQTTSIIDDLNTAKAGEGKITIYQDESIKNLVGTSIISTKYADPNALKNQLSNDTEGSNSSKQFVKAKGFRIQVYTGSDQKTAKNEAQSRKNTVASSYPNMEVNVVYNSPVWRVKAGNFQTREQAQQALNEMKDKFPSFGREMYIINDVIKIPVAE